jgi:hypothetical protein
MKIVFTTKDPTDFEKILEDYNDLYQSQMTMEIDKTAKPQKVTLKLDKIKGYEAFELGFKLGMHSTCTQSKDEKSV